MRKYAKVTNEETKACEVGIGTNIKFYQSIGMSEMEVEQGYDGQWYLAGYAPEKTIEQKEADVRTVRNQYLSETDKYMISDFPVSKTEKAAYKSYRQYLRDYTEQEEWWTTEPLAFEAWKELP